MTVNKKVLIFRKRVLPYSETFIADQALSLCAYDASFAGYTKEIAGGDLIRNKKSILLEDYVNTIGLEKLKLRMGGGSTGWLSSLKSLDFDVMHSHFFADSLDAISISKKLSLPLVSTVHGLDISKTNLSLFNALRKRYFCRRVDKVIAVSKYIYRQAVIRGIPECKLIQSYIGIDLNKFTLQKNESDYPQILFVGRLVCIKGVEYLLRAMIA